MSRERFKPTPILQPQPEEGDLIESHPVIIRVEGQWYEAMAIADVTGEGEPYVRFEPLPEPQDDLEPEIVEESEVLQAVDEALGSDIHRNKAEVENVIGALVASSLSGGEAVLDVRGSRLKTVKYEPHDTTLIPTLMKSSSGKRVPVLRKEDLSEPETDDS